MKHIVCFAALLFVEGLLLIVTLLDMLGGLRWSQWVVLVAFT